MRIRRTFVSAALGLCAFMVFGGANSCDSTSSTAKAERNDTAVVDQQQTIYQNGQPIPLFNYSQQRATLIDVYKAKTAGTATYTVVYSFGRPVFTCPSIGFPIPATTQLTNPERIGYTGYNIGALAFPQAEPDGTYTGQTAVTYVLCVRSDGSVSPVYSEPDVMTFTYPVKIVDGQIVDAGGKSTVTVETKQ